MEHIVVAVGVRVRPGLDFGLRSTAKDKNQHEQARRCELPRANRSATGVRGDRISLANASRRILARPAAAARGPLPDLWREHTRTELPFGHGQYVRSRLRCRHPRTLRYAHRPTQCENYVEA